MISLETSRQISNDYLQTFLQNKRALATSLHPNYERLLGEIERVTLAGGKRLRPHLVFVGYGAQNDFITPLAVGYELLHTALLVHDDIIDRDAVRHNQATIHHAYHEQHYTNLSDPRERHHFSTSAAILAGDLLISWAYELLGSMTMSADAYRQSSMIMSDAIFNVAGGELIDTESPFSTVPIDPIVVAKYKTASYSFVGPLLAGAVLSSPHYSDESLNKLREYATTIGIAFQIRDDILGIFGDEAKTGKSTVGDLREGKRTVLIDFFTKSASPDELALFQQQFGNPDATDESLVELKELLRTSPAYAQTTELERNYLAQAAAALDNLKSEPLYNDLHELSMRIQGRGA